jgi:putative FmdB family regulatory protein
MPVYAYRCSRCDSSFERLRGISQQDSDVECPECGQQGTAKRLISTFAAFSKTDGMTHPSNQPIGGNDGGGCQRAGGCACHGGL